MGFKESFTKDNAQDELLGYDDAAFYYFASSVLVTLAVPWTYYFIKGTIFGDEPKDQAGKSKSGSKSVACKTSDMVKKQGEEKEGSKRRSCGIGWWFQLVVLALMWFSIYFVFTQMGVDEVKSFDPFKLLGVSSSASTAEIKKAHKKLALIHHPDKNPNDPAASARFIELTKAYNALTDPAAKANYEKYGNPDGPTMTKVGIGLPKFLLEKENHLVILCVFFLMLLVIIPTIAICYWTKTKGYAGNGVLIETLQFMETYINETTRAKNCPELLAASAESRLMPTRVGDQVPMNKIKAEVEQHAKLRFNHPVILKNSLLLLAHMQRMHELMTPELRSDLNQLLKHSMRITQAMIEYSCARNWFFTAQSIIDFRRGLVQALDVKASQLLQIPHFDEEVLKHCTRGKNATSTLMGFMSKPAEERKGLKGLTPEQLLDIEAFAQHLSAVELSAEVTIEDEEDIVVGDIATVEVVMKRTNLREGEAVGPVHAPLFPEAKYEEWLIFLTEPAPSNRMIAMERVRDTDQIVEVKLRFQVTGKGGKKKLELHAMCDSYSGLDKKLDISFTVKEEDETKREIFIHKEDEDLDLQPTLFQQLMGDFGGGDEESDDEHDDEAPVKDKSKGKANGKATGKADGKADGKANGKAAKKAAESEDEDEGAEDDAASSGSSSDSD